MTPEQHNLNGWIDAYRRKEQEVGDLKAILAQQDVRVAELEKAIKDALDEPNAMRSFNILDTVIRPKH